MAMIEWLSEREKILREFNIGPLEELYVGAIDERIKADELIKSNGISVRSATRIYDEKDKKEYIQIKMHVAPSEKGEEPHKVTLFLEEICEKKGIKEYFPKMEKTEHSCKETRYITSGADHHMLAAKGYVEIKENLEQIGKEYGLGKIKPYASYMPIPKDLVDSLRYGSERISANNRLRRAYEYARERYTEILRQRELKEKRKERAKKIQE